MGTYEFNWLGSDFYSEYVRNGDYPEVRVLYKYRSWNNPFHQKLLTDCVVYLASPNSFEDQYDCRLPEDFPTLIELPKFFYQESFEHLPPSATKYDRFLFVLKLCKESPLANRKIRNKLSQEIYQKFCRRFGVLSLTADPYNDIMWEKYAENHSGFCIGYGKKILEQSIKGGAGPVLYAKDLPHIEYFKEDIMIQHCKNTYFKEMQWSYEKEYRMHKLWNIDVSEDERNIHVPKEAIVEIILGSEMSTENEDAIRNIAVKKYPKAKILNETNRN